MTHLRKPAWLKVEKGGLRCGRVGRVLDQYGLNTVCEQAGCPNKGECFKNGTATFMLLGSNCTRNCTFCKVVHNRPDPVDHDEPENIAKAVEDMGIRHVVATSVTRDDLPDGGAAHFAETVKAVRRRCHDVVIEVLIPDFQGSKEDLLTVLDAGPDILNHNVETVPELYGDVRPMAEFSRSVELLRRAKEYAPHIFTKSGFMVGLGETEEQVVRLLTTLNSVGCDIVTIGQYLQPTSAHYQVKEYIHPDIFEKYKNIALDLGIKYAACGPLVRSSYHAQADFQVLRKAVKPNKEE